jgi:hypothetical protein
MVWHNWRLLCGFNLSLTFWEEESLKTKLKSLRVDDWCNGHGPVKINSSVYFVNTVGFSDRLVD